MFQRTQYHSWMRNTSLHWLLAGVLDLSGPIPVDIEPLNKALLCSHPISTHLAEQAWQSRRKLGTAGAAAAFDFALAFGGGAGNPAGVLLLLLLLLLLAADGAEGGTATGT